MPRLALILLLLPLLVAADEAPAPEPTWFVQRVTTGDAPLRVEYFWSKGASLRAETVVAGRAILTIVTGEFYYILDGLGATGVAIRRSPAALAADATRGRPFGEEAAQMLEDGAEKVGVDQSTGRPCDVYRLTDGRGRREICLTQDDYKLPLHAEVYERASSRRVVTRYLDWSRGFPAVDSFFAPDPRITLERVEYEDYLGRSGRATVGPAPVLFRELLHGP